MKNRVIIVDDHVLFAKGLAGLIDTLAGFLVEKVLKNGAELVDYLTTGKTKDPDIILLDVNMPIMDGLATMKWLKKFRPGIPVLVISMEDDDDTIVSMIKNGGKGYLLKDAEPDVLLNALNTILDKGYFHTELVSKSLMNSMQNEGEEEKKIILKNREIEFLKWVCQEKTYKEIAELMNCSTHTVDNYREALFQKLGVKSRTGMIIYAIKSGIVEV